MIHPDRVPALHESLVPSAWTETFGFSLENYNRYGNYGSVDAGQPVDAVDQFLVFALEQSEAQSPVLDASHEQDRARMQQAFMQSGRTYRSLIKAFAQGQAIGEN